MGLVSRLRSIRDGGSGDSSSGPDEGRESGADVSRSLLFECPECETVYVADEMERCSRCDVAVELVRPAEPPLAPAE